MRVPVILFVVIIVGIVLTFAMQEQERLTAPPTEVDQGRVIGSTYRNDSLDMQLTWPSDWEVISRGDLDQAQQQMSQAEQQQAERLRFRLLLQLVRDADDPTSPVLTMSTMANRNPGTPEVRDGFFDSFQKSMARNHGVYSTKSDAEEVEINGHRYWRVDFDYFEGTRIVRFRNYILFADGFALHIAMVARDVKQLAELEAILKTLGPVTTREIR